MTTQNFNHDYATRGEKYLIMFIGSLLWCLAIGAVVSLGLVATGCTPTIEVAPVIINRPKPKPHNDGDHGWFREPVEGQEGNQEGSATSETLAVSSDFVAQVRSAAGDSPDALKTLRRYGSLYLRLSNSVRAGEYRYVENITSYCDQMKAVLQMTPGDHKELAAVTSKFFTSRFATLPHDPTQLVNEKLEGNEQLTEKWANALAELSESFKQAAAR